MVVLATGASVNLVLEPIYSSAVWGAGWYNAAEAAHYADAALRYEGNIDLELQMGASGKFWDFLSKFIIASRAYPRSLEISPDGAHVYRYMATNYDTTYDNKGAWCTSANFSTSEGAFVTCSLGVVAIYRTESDPTGSGANFSNYTYIKQSQGVVASKCSDLAITNPLNPLGGNVDPIPFWKTNAQLSCDNYADEYTPFDTPVLPQEGLETVDWSIDISNNQKILYTCSGDRLPRAVLMGPMSVDGNVTLYNQAGVFDPILGPAGTGTLEAPYLYAEKTKFRIAIQKPAGAGNVYIEMPAVVVASDDYSIQGADSVTNRAFSLKGLGGRCSNDITLPPCIISSYAGALVGPPV